MGNFTEFELAQSHTKSGCIQWYEFIPSDEKDFKRIVAEHLSKHNSVQDIAKRILRVNSACKTLKLNVSAVNASTTMDEWMETYWQLYAKNIVRLAYQKRDIGQPEIVMFSVYDNNVQKTVN